MAYHPNTTIVQIEIIEEAMKKAEVWSNRIPAWISNYNENNIIDIWQWLQFIYLPMRRNGTISEPHYIAPILSPYIYTETKYRDILQLVIELDSISPTLEKKQSV